MSVTVLPSRTAGTRDAWRAWPRVVLRAIGRFPALVLIAAVRTYQAVISPMTGPTCRYYPSCSQYALVAVRRHGAVRGTWLALTRLLRCHPWAAGGVDDVPTTDESQASSPGPGRTPRARRSAHEHP